MPAKGVSSLRDWSLRLRCERSGGRRDFGGVYEVVSAAHKRETPAIHPLVAETFPWNSENRRETQGLAIEGRHRQAR